MDRYSLTNVGLNHTNPLCDGNTEFRNIFEFTLFAALLSMCDSTNTNSPVFNLTYCLFML